MLCPYAKKCSGCQLQNMEYEEQLSYKQAKVVGLLGRFAHVEKIIPMEEPTHYRNKVQTAFGFYRGRILAGVYQSASGNIVPAESCLLEDEGATAICKTIKALCEKHKIHVYDHRSGKGFFRHVMVRKSHKNSDYMVVLVTTKGVFNNKNFFVDDLLSAHPEISTVVRNINDTDKGLMLGEKSEIYYGSGYITENLCGLDFRISPKSFFQVNHLQTERLYSTVANCANLSGKETLLDAYCGTGTIGLSLAGKAKKVIGVEVNPDAVRDANVNAEINGITNAEFIAADAGWFMEKLLQGGESPDVVITDPPRAGCNSRFLKSLIALAPKKVVYVSCNPETLARDLYSLRSGGYKVKKIQPVDMFPFTNHVETVVLLSRV
jgi:23S rRNA (uracil1939-C5)-methyltransferase